MKKSNKFMLLPVMLLASAMGVSAQTNGAAAQDKAVFLIMGDSVMKTVSVLLERDLAQSAAFRPVSFASIGSGLCRLDLLDWHAKIKTLVEEDKPAAAVILIGSNDNQPMKTDKGVFRQGSDEWQEEYARRIAKCMDIMIQGGVKKIIWIALPDMRDPALQELVLIINRIISKEAATRPSIVVLDSQKIFSREPGKFTMYVFGADGKPIYLRAQDGVHFTREGANRLATIIVKTLNEPRKQ